MESSKSQWTEDLISRNCPCCDSNDTKVISKKMKDGINLPTVICKKCALVYSNPIPKVETINRFYTEAYNDYYIHIPKLEIPNRIPSYMEKIIEVIVRHLPDKNSSILEIGSGNGLLLYYLQKKYKNALGIEPGPNIKDAISRFGLNAIHGFFETYDFGDKKFDALMMLHVFEHFYDINETLEKCNSLLKKDGLLFFELPNIHKPYHSLDNYFLRYVHLINYSESSVENMLRKHGFEVVYRKTSRHSYLSPYNLFVVAQKKEKAANNNYSGDYKKTVRILNEYRLKWYLFEKYFVFVYAVAANNYRHFVSSLLKTRFGDQLRKRKKSISKQLYQVIKKAGIY
ncbi:MAG: class I SAM-dependent methyltransferase [Prolixibacteraceae bacterium]